MFLKVATLISCILFSGCLSELGKRKLPDNIEKRVRDAHSQDEVGYDPYSDWLNNAHNANIQDNSNAADESLVDTQRQDVKGWNWGKTEEQDDDEASDSDEGGWREVKQQEDGENIDSKPPQGDDDDDIMIQFFNHPGDKKVQEEVNWNDRDFLKEEVEKARKQGVYLDDQNDDKSIFQNDAWNSIWDDDSNVEQQSSDRDLDDDNRVEQQSNGGNSENSYFETEGVKQEKLQDEKTNTPNQQMLEKNYNTNNIEDLWNELNGMQQVETQNNAEDHINKQIDDTNKESKGIGDKLTEALAEKMKEIRCKTERKYKNAEECVKDGLDDKIKNYTSQLEALKSKLEHLEKELQKAQKSGRK